MKAHICLVLLMLCMHPGRAAAGQAVNVWEPHPAGKLVSTTITFGDEYATPVEVYDARISVVEILRGDRAWDLLRKESASNRLPDPEFEYVLARIRFEFAARGKPGDKSYVLREDQFVANSSDGLALYPAASCVLPAPELGRVLRSGDSSQGWIAFLVARKDQKPVLVFHADVRVLSHSGTGLVFRLY